MNENLHTTVGRFLDHKRALGRQYHSEEHELRLLVRFARTHRAHRLDQLTPALIQDFLASRSRPRPRSFNHLLGVVRGLLDWAVAHELLEASPLQVRPRRVTSTRIPFLFDAAQARRLLAAAAVLPDNSRAVGRGPTYRTIFALCYGLGLRAGEACGLRMHDVDTPRRLLLVRGGKFGKSRLVPHGPRIAELVGDQVQRRQADGATSPDAALFSFDGHHCVHPGTASATFHRLVATLDLTVPDGVCPPTLHSRLPSARLIPTPSKYVDAPHSSSPARDRSAPGHGRACRRAAHRPGAGSGVQGAATCSPVGGPGRPADRLAGRWFATTTGALPWASRTSRRTICPVTLREGRR